MADFPVNFGHLGTLFAVDADRDGRISLKDLIDFAKMWASQQRNYERFDFQVLVHPCVQHYKWRTSYIHHVWHR